MAYAAQGVGAYYFVTRDPEALEYLEKTRNLIMDPNKYWDVANGRVLDGMSHDLHTPKDQSGGGFELVAGLDQINAYMVLVQPVLPSQELRDGWAEDLRKLATGVLENFWQDGVFFGQSARVGNFSSRHTDLGHNMKSHWMMGLVGELVGYEPWTRFSTWSGIPWIGQGFDEEFGIWGGSMVLSIKHTGRFFLTLVRMENPEGTIILLLLKCGNGKMDFILLNTP